jgi:hypothetical protein
MDLLKEHVLTKAIIIKHLSPGFRRRPKMLWLYEGVNSLIV